MTRDTRLHDGREIPRFDWHERSTGSVWAMARGNPNCEWMQPGKMIAVFHDDGTGGPPSFYEPRRLGTVVAVQWSAAADAKEHVVIIDMLDQPPVFGPLPEPEPVRVAADGHWLPPALAIVVVLVCLVLSCVLVGCGAVQQHEADKAQEVRITELENEVVDMERLLALLAEAVARAEASIKNALRRLEGHR